MSLESLTASLYKSYEAKKYEEAAAFLPAIKLHLIKHKLLVPLTNADTTKNHYNDLRISKKILEIGAFISINLAEFAQFEQYFIYLKAFYGNAHITNMNKDAQVGKIYSLYLLYLLSQGEFSKFHSELELVYNTWPAEVVASDQFLRFPTNLEKNLMEGNYIKIWQLYAADERELPLAEFKLFERVLIDSLRSEIATNISKSYLSLPVVNIKELLHLHDFSGAQIETKIAEEYGWTLHNGVVHFAAEAEEGAEESNHARIIKNVLGYASEIETIV
ncbi:hypothetical protein BABINDRAFT_36396 [Babjeviella inositovora NRRL Y-12698]|uniref:PCI domain-containing protein n=1 Tax=Babjeviella inositovora NRRL Y-12698 TaxID=984486 RepID=A0A1E3QQE9_9ASCO|nr:uncharacterized protein BABINDRAFT_36396 [Babjeviella inositovora NRRL Y-12698]ODQ79909.1 hypothetical protein BABINDRAFT_36396 [Babjeviella inositovora NRRL Y-12698]